ncbi:hypothetical protein J4411_01385 [Candidatus Pacearchaeota archaeon]|nr:hypothetical protein [Candidatus Pacearchaeota archaeon]
MKEGIKRIHKYSFVLESERVKKVYGWSGSNIGKILILGKEFSPDRLNLIFVNEDLGF